MSQATSYRVALIGGGIIAKNHLDAIQVHPELQAVAIADIDRSKAEVWAEAYDLQAFTNYQEMIETERPDIAVIALPHFLHKECAVWCAGKGCHILLEKPMALTLEQCNEILAAATEAKVTLLVGHTQHYWPANLQAKKLIESGRLGPLIAIQDTRHLPYFSEERPRWFLEKAKSGGGILMNLGAHSIDKIQFLTSSRVDRISASMTKYGSIGDVEGSSVLFLTTSTGVAATIVQSGYLGKPLDLTELIFTGGRARLISSAGLWVSEGQEFEIESLDALEDPFIRMYQDLVQEIEEKKPPGSSGMYARSVIAAIEAAYLSHDEGAERKIDPFK